MTRGIAIAIASLVTEQIVATVGKVHVTDPATPVTLYTDSARTVPATVYTDATMGATLTQPLTPNSAGQVTGYVAPNAVYYWRAGTLTGQFEAIPAGGAFVVESLEGLNWFKGRGVYHLQASGMAAAFDGVTDDAAAWRAGAQYVRGYGPGGKIIVPASAQGSVIGDGGLAAFGAIVSVPTGCVFEGDGRGPALVKLKAGSNVPGVRMFMNDDFQGHTGGNPKIQMRGLTVDGNKANQSITSHVLIDFRYSDAVELDHMEIQNADFWAGQFQACTRSKLIDSIIHHTGKHGWNSSGGSLNLFSRVHVHDIGSAALTGGRGLLLADDWSLIAECIGDRMNDDSAFAITGGRGNAIYGSKADGDSAILVVSDTASVVGASIKRNTLRTSRLQVDGGVQGYCGVLVVKGSAGTVSQVAVRNNDILDCWRSAIMFQGVSDCVAADNDVYNIGQDTANPNWAVIDLRMGMDTITPSTNIRAYRNVGRNGPQSLNLYAVRIALGCVSNFIIDNDFTGAGSGAQHPLLDQNAYGQNRHERNLGMDYYYAAAAPVSGIYNFNDRVINTNPTAGGYEGWICTVAGTPGTFKGFGALQA